MARKRVLLLLVAAFAVAGASVAVAQASTGGRSHHHDGDRGGGGPATATPIKHLVVIFQENVSFDHYFGTYPDATNPDGQPFYASPRTPVRERAGGAAADGQPELEQPAAPERRTGGDVRPGPRLQRRAERLRPWADGHVRPEDRRKPDARAVPEERGQPGARRRHQSELRGHGLLRRQHRDRPVELRPALRDERQLVRDKLRSLDAGRDQRDRDEHVRRDLRPDERRGQRAGVRRPARDPADDSERVATAAGAGHDVQRLRSQLRHLLLDPGREDGRVRRSRWAARTSATC